MPQIFRVAGYLIYFWSNENEPLEPVHVHITNGVPTANATKVWITQSGKCLLCHNNSKIPSRVLRDLIDVNCCRADYFQNHIIKRAIMLLNAIEKATGKTIDGRSSEVVVRDFGGVLL